MTTTRIEQERGIDIERAAFEKDAELTGYAPRNLIRRSDGGAYVNQYIESRWNGWQARAAIPQAPGDVAEVRAQGVDAKDIAISVAHEALHHIDSMYPGMWKPVAKLARTSIRNTIINQSQRFIALLNKENSMEAARYRYIEEHANTKGGGNGFTITCFVPVDHEDIGCGIDAAISLATKNAPATTEEGQA